MQKGLLEETIKCLRDLYDEGFLKDQDMNILNRDIKIKRVLNLMATMIAELDERLKKIEEKL